MRRLQSGFTLIELMVSVGIIGILAATSIPSYHTYLKQAKLLAGEIELYQALRDYSVFRGYSPPTGMLDELVSAGLVREIPNDPWTSISEKITGAEEAEDWYYTNDGETLTLFARSHPGRVYHLPSFGRPPIAEPAPPVQVAEIAPPHPAGVSGKPENLALDKKHKSKEHKSKEHKDKEHKDKEHKDKDRTGSW